MREIVGREALDASVRFAVFSVAYAAFIYRGQSTATLLGGYGSRGSAGSPAVTLWIGLSSGVEEAAVPRQQVSMVLVHVDAMHTAVVVDEMVSIDPS